MRLVPALLVLLLGFAAVPMAGALVAHQEPVRGQVAKILTAEIHGETHGVVLAVERSTNEEPYAELRLIPGPDPAEWIVIPLKGAPGAIATGDVDGDRNDDVAIAHNLAGGSCPTSAGFDLPCGIIKVYDGPGLADGSLDVLATMRIAPTVETCAPSTYSTSMLALGDATGDGRAEMAFTQLGSMEGTCGTVRVVPGEQLQGEVVMDDVCAKMQGRPVQANAQPDQFGVHLELFPGHLAIGAPYAGNAQGVPFAGRLDVYDVRAACQGPPNALALPTLAFSRSGTQPGGLLGSDTAYTKDKLWIAAKNLVEGFGLPSFKPERSLDIPRAFPLSVAKDLDSDGRAELLAGPWLVDYEGDMILQAYPFGAETFRGAVLGRDHIVSSDKFGTRLWSLTDVWNPHLSLFPESATVPVGGDVKVRVAQAISLLPKAWPVQWQVAGGMIIEEGDGWVLVGKAESGYVTVQATMEDTVATVRIPVQPPAGQVTLTGADAVHAGHPLVIRVNAPTDSTITWSAPGGVPSEGSGETVSTTYANVGKRTVSVRVTLPDGTAVIREHPISVIEGVLRISGPTAIVQGTLLQMAVVDADDAHTHSWIVEGAHTGIIRSAGTVFQAPIGGWGTVNVTSIAKTANGDAVKVGYAKLTVANLPPSIDAMEAKASQASLAIEATGGASDPGGDAVQLEWSVDGLLVGHGASLQVTLREEKWVNVTLTATDESGLSASLTRPLFARDPWGLTDSDTNGTVQNLGNTTEPGAAPLVEPAVTDKGRELSVPGPGILLVLTLLAAVLSRRKG